VPNLLCRELVFIHYIDRKASPSKREPSSSQRDAAKETAVDLDMLANAAAADAPPLSDPHTKKKNIDVKPFDMVVETHISDDDIVLDDRSDDSSLDEPGPKRLKRLHQGKDKEKASPSSRSHLTAGAGGGGGGGTNTPDLLTLPDVEVKPAKKIPDLLNELSTPRIEKEIPVSGNSQFAAIADQLYG
jgi:hypothetical protein